MNFSDIKEKTIQKVDKIWYQTKDTGRKVILKGQEAVRWALDNPEKFAALCGGLAVGNKLVRSIHRNVTLRHEIYDKKHRIYDHSMNAYVYTKRPLKARDIERINQERRRSGKRVSEILSDMDLLRR